VQIAKGVHTTLDHADNLVPEVAVYLKIVTSTLAHLAEVVVDAMETAIDENGDCEDDYHLATVNALLPDVQTKVVDIQTKVTDIQEKVDRLQDLALRVPIEVDLRRTGEDRVGLFQLPQGYGGQLEMVREIVVETINMHWAAGQSVHDSLARRSLADGDVFALRREFKRAYDNYRLAYQLAVKP
jgi:hypothetical protein